MFSKNDATVRYHVT